MAKLVQIASDKPMWLGWEAVWDFWLGPLPRGVQLTVAVGAGGCCCQMVVEQWRLWARDFKAWYWSLQVLMLTTFLFPLSLLFADSYSVLSLFVF